MYSVIRTVFALPSIEQSSRDYRADAGPRQGTSHPHCGRVGRFQNHVSLPLGSLSVSGLTMIYSVRSTHPLTALHSNCVVHDRYCTVQVGREPIVARRLLRMIAMRAPFSPLLDRTRKRARGPAGMIPPGWFRRLCRNLGDGCRAAAEHAAGYNGSDPCCDNCDLTCRCRMTARKNGA